MHHLKPNVWKFACFKYRACTVHVNGAWSWPTLQLCDAKVDSMFLAVCFAQGGPVVFLTVNLMVSSTQRGACLEQ
jgi:hypothetical protein